MSNIALTQKAAKPMKLCNLEGYRCVHDLLRASTTDCLCPAMSRKAETTRRRWSPTKTLGTAKRVANASLRVTVSKADSVTCNGPWHNPTL